MVYKLGWISFFADVSSEVAYPLIPLFLTEVLKAPVAALGFVEGTAEAVVSLMKGWSGFHSDRSGRRSPYIQAGYGLSALGKPLIALAFAWPLVLVARVADRFGKGLRTTSRDALIADSVESHLYGRAFGLHGGMDTAGALLGVLLALLLVWTFHIEYRTVFLAAGIPGAVSFLITLTLKERPRPHVESAPSTIKLSDLPRRFWWALSLCLVFAFANSSNSFLLLLARKNGFSAVGVILAYALYNLLYVSVSYPAGSLSDRYGRWSVLLFGWALYALVYAGFAFLGGAYLWWLFALYGIVIGVTTGVNKALVADLSPKGGRGTALGAFFMASGLVTLVTNLIGGWLWDSQGPRATLLMWSAAAGLAALLVPFCRKLAIS